MTRDLATGSPFDLAWVGGGGPDVADRARLSQSGITGVAAVRLTSMQVWRWDWNPMDAHDQTSLSEPHDLPAPETRKPRAPRIEPLPKASLPSVQRVIAGLGLTPRQASIVELVSYGYGPRRIAMEMNIADATVRAHLRATFMRLKVGSRVELIAEVLRRVVAEERPSRDSRSRAAH